MTTKEQKNEYMRKWNLKNKKRLNEKQRERYRNDLDYKEYMINRAKDYRKNNKDKKYQQDKKYKDKNKEKYIQYMKKYYKDNTIKFMKYSKQHYETIGKLMNLDWKSYKWKLLAWSKAVRKRDNNQCQVCFKPAVHAHHIFYKQFYPELSLNLNNGISLCKEHHDEVHGKNLKRFS